MRARLGFQKSRQVILRDAFEDEFFVVTSDHTNRSATLHASTVVVLGACPSNDAALERKGREGR
jgi:hypothetical protein